MKPLIFSSIFLVLSLFCFSQESQVFESSLGVDIRVTAITTDEHYVLRKIELIDRSADTAFDTFEHEIVSDEGETESIEVALNAGTFSGFIYIKSGETVIVFGVRITTLNERLQRLYRSEQNQTDNL